MLIVMKAGASRADVAGVEEKIRALGFTPNEIPGSTRLAIGITGNQGALDPGMFTVMAGVARRRLESVAGYNLAASPSHAHS